MEDIILCWSCSFHLALPTSSSESTILACVFHFSVAASRSTLPFTSLFPLFSPCAFLTSLIFLLAVPTLTHILWPHFHSCYSNLPLEHNLSALLISGPCLLSIHPFHISVISMVRAYMFIPSWSHSFSLPTALSTSSVNTRPGTKEGYKSNIKESINAWQWRHSCPLRIWEKN